MVDKTVFDNVDPMLLLSPLLPFALGISSSPVEGTPQRLNVFHDAFELLIVGKRQTIYQEQQNSNHLTTPHHLIASVGITYTS